MKRLAPCGLLALLFLLLATGPLRAEERILDYGVEIEVQADASMIVTETIQARAEGQEIRHGIYRDFPTDYRDPFGNRYRVDFELLDALRDGVSEPHHSERLGNGIRVYLGNADQRVEPGLHTYRIRYRTDRQLGYFQDHDELYWNVTGNDWAFPIDHAHAEVRLPPSIRMDETTQEAYTGAQGAQGRAYRAWRTDRNTLAFETSAPLNPREGLTIVATWPKGRVYAPDAEQRLRWMVADNAYLITGGAGLLLVLAYYLAVWVRVGRDPATGALIPLYTPPQNLSPASMRFIERMGYDHKTFAAALVNLAVKGAVFLDSDEDVYSVRRSGREVDLAPGEKALLGSLFDGRGRVDFTPSNHKVIAAALNAHHSSLARDYETIYFRTNSRWIAPGVLLTLAAIAASVLGLPGWEQRATTAFLAVWLSGWSVAVLFLLRMAWRSWRAARAIGGYASAIFNTFFAIPFVAGEVAGIFALFSTGAPGVAVFILGGAGLNILFYQLLKAPTLAGRAVLDRIEGFRLYLNVAEGDELKLRNAPRKTPELYETYLPYAIALDVETRWGERFAEVFAGLGHDDKAGKPSWYHGHDWDPAQPTRLASTLGAELGSAIASSSTAPGSSSGSGGGGSSGGGGGGGGGGGW